MNYLTLCVKINTDSDVTNLDMNFAHLFFVAAQAGDKCQQMAWNKQQWLTTCCLVSFSS